jgi:hypothetical protein
LYQLPSARNFAKIVMNLKTHGIGSHKLQADLDSVQFQVASDQYIPPSDDAIPELVPSFAGKVYA